MRLFFLIVLISSSLLEAQIYADFSVSSGGASLGTFRARLDFEKAPRTCANFIGLASGQRPFVNPANGQVEKRPFYDGVIFHRLIHDFVIQGGSPLGTGADNPGFFVVDEFEPTLRHNGRYILSMAKTDLPNTGGSQFFITLANASFLDDRHSVFGEVINDATHPNGRAIIDGFTSAVSFPTDPSNRPTTDIRIDSVSITRIGVAAMAFDINDPALRLPHIVNSPTMRAFNAQGVSETSTGSVTLGFTALDRHAYILSESSNLENWSEFANLTFFESFQNFEINLSQTGNRFFSRVASIDYTDLADAPVDLLADGNRLRVYPAAGGFIDLMFDGSAGGTWSDSLGNSGTLSSVSYFDRAPNANFFLNTQPTAFFYSLGLLSCNFSAPAGSQNWTQFTNLNLSFHEPTSGWADNGVFGLPTSAGRISPRFDFFPN